MDPNTAYRMMAEHFANGQYSEAHDMAEGLLSWVRSGGFLPDVDGPTSSRIVGTKCVKMMAECRSRLADTLDA